MRQVVLFGALVGGLAAAAEPEATSTETKTPAEEGAVPPQFPETVTPEQVEAIQAAGADPYDGAVPPQFPETVDPALVDAIRGAAPEPDPLATIRGAHGADRPVHVRRNEAWDTWGELRGRIIGATDPALDPQGTLSGRSLWGSSRFVIGADWKPSSLVTVEMELEALNGLVAGGTLVGTSYADDVFRVRRADSADLERIVPRKLGVAVNLPKAGQLRVGVQMFSWGAGMLANDGAGDPDFGDPNTGSVVARVGFFTQPARNATAASFAARNTTIFVAGDVVLRDDNADIFAGDLAVAGIVGFRVAHRFFELGGFGVARWQQDREDVLDPRPDRTTVTAFPIDLYAKASLLKPGGPHRLILEAEGVLIEGTTTRPWIDETLSGGTVESFGALGRLRYDHDALRITAKLEAGFASGDNDTRDSVARTFAMHSDHNVGLILFEELLPLISARALDRAADPELVARPSPAGRYTVNQGTVSNAVYLNPVLRVQPVERLDVRFGYLAAWSAADFIDVFESGKGGGYNTTPGGVTGGSHFYGHEVDLSLRYTVKLPGGLGLEIGGEGGVLAPSAAFDGVGGSRLGLQVLGRGRLAVRW